MKVYKKDDMYVMDIESDDFYNVWDTSDRSVEAAAKLRKKQLEIYEQHMKEEELRRNNAALQNAWEQYQILLKLTQGHK